MNKLVYMHYPKSRTSGAAFCMERICFFIRDEGCGGIYLQREKEGIPPILSLFYYPTHRPFNVASPLREKQGTSETGKV